MIDKWKLFFYQAAEKETILDILDLHRSGLTQRAIARRLRISHNTVKKYLARIAA